jgi:hypothetical protein
MFYFFWGIIGAANGHISVTVGENQAQTYLKLESVPVLHLVDGIFLHMFSLFVF